jgi:cell division protein FtsZ
MQEMGMAMMGTGCAAGEDRARVAAQQAISSPLLEDVDLSGAHGILVNMTAGLNMTIGEFEEMGNVVQEFASESATVVVGSVIDPEMGDEVRVTVIATGVEPTAISSQNKVAAKSQRVANKSAISTPTANTMRAEKAQQSVPAHPEPEPQVREEKREEIDYNKLERPTRFRKKTPAMADDGENLKEGNTDYLDIPAFLRRQAD